MPSERVRLARRGPAGSSRAENLHIRARALGALRQALSSRGYLEVEPNVLVKAPGTDPHIEPIAVPGYGFLSPSPEFQMKRLLVGGLGRIFSIGPAFRAGEWGPHHEVEFSLAEWYAPGVTYQELAAELEEILREVALRATGRLRLETPAGPVDLEEPWERLTVAEAFRRGLGTEPEDDPARFRQSVARSGVFVPEDADWEEVFFRAFVERVEPLLGRGRPTFLFDWPPQLAALARLKEVEPGQTVAERFELFAGGLELANAFGELTDPEEQRERFQEDVARRAARGSNLPVDEKFLDALGEGMPDASGVALGFDRLVMLLCGAGHIAEVRPFVFQEL